MEKLINDYVKLATIFKTYGLKLVIMTDKEFNQFAELLEWKEKQFAITKKMLESVDSEIERIRKKIEIANYVATNQPSLHDGKENKETGNKKK